MHSSIWQRHDSIVYRLYKEHEEMKARKVFIALMTGKGYAESELEWDGEKFANQNMTTRWNYFLLGWEMRGVCD
jgi:hypothetical protein